MTPAAVLWPLTPGVRVGWGTCPVPNPAAGGARGRVFLFRGTGAVFSPGFGRLCAALRAAGVWAEDLRSLGDGWAVRQVLAARERGEPAGPVALVGHSRGGRRALVAAGRLGEAGVAVAVVVCVDVAFPPAVPGNVRRAVHVFLSRRRLYPARPLIPAPGSAAAIENVDLDASGSPVPGRGLHHLNITASEAVRELVVGRVLDAVRAAG